MALSSEQIARLLKVLMATEREEVDCDECLPLMAANVDGHFGPDEEETLARLVRTHLEICPECAEEYELLELALTELDSAN